MWWLMLISLYLLYHGKYKKIFFFWVFFFFNWYGVYTLLMIGFEGPILIGGEHTGDLLCYIADNAFMFEVCRSFCFETTFLVHFVSNYLEVVIPIPSLFKGILAMLKFVFGGGKGPSV